MQGYIVVMVFNLDSDRLLMCMRKKEPYKGMFSLISGTKQEKEKGSEAAYRGLYNDTGIHPTEIELHHLLDMGYPLSESFVEVFAGRLKRDRSLRGTDCHLVWVDLEQDFFDVQQFAGDGNIVHMLELVKMYKDQVLA